MCKSNEEVCKHSQTITWEHDRNDNMEEILTEARHIKDVIIEEKLGDILITSNSLLTEISSLTGILWRELLYTQGSGFMDHINEVMATSERFEVYKHNGGTIVFRELPDNVTEYKVFGNVKEAAKWFEENVMGCVEALKKEEAHKPKGTRKGKFSKALNAWKIDSEMIKNIMTRVNAKNKVYGLYSSNNFYNHYRKMQIEGVTQSCMSKVPGSYNVRLNTAVGINRYNPVIAYEQSKDWELMLIRDYSKPGYNFVARSVVLTPESSYYRIYGNSVTMDKVLDSAGYIKENPSNVGVFNLLKTVEPNGDIIEGETVLPYVDGCTNAEVDFDGLSIFVSEDGDIECSHTSGTVSTCDRFCYGCDGTIDYEDCYVCHGEEYCGDCLGTEIVINNYGEIMLYDEAHEIDGEWYDASECTFADDIEEYILTDDALYCETDMLYYSEAALSGGDLIEIEGCFFLATDEALARDEEGEWFLNV
jgi:hypothetical protein